MTSQLTAYIDSARVGWFLRESSGGIRFVYDDDWRASAGRLELTLSMPKSRRQHDGEAPANFLWNLLPDNEAVLERWGARFGVSPRNPMSLLSHVGMDTAGAVQLSESDATDLPGEGALEAISDEDLAAHIRQLRKDPSDWLLPGHSQGAFSLAGAQSKFTLARIDGAWAVPTGRSASTHIFKPGIQGLEFGDLNEHLTMSATAAAGLDVAESRILRVGGEHAIVVERYDRVTDQSGSVSRVHQEDLAQALGVHPALKYQAEGGPGVHGVMNAILGSRGRDSAKSASAFVDAVLFNWIALGTDAHAKNYSLIHDPRRGPRLAPLYDVTSALPYPAFNNRNARFAMSFDRRYKDFEIELRHVVRECARAGLGPDDVIDRLRSLIARVPDAFSSAKAESELDGDEAAFAGRLVNAAESRVNRLRREIRRWRGDDLDG